jgi:hypothetical protein
MLLLEFTDFHLSPSVVFINSDKKALKFKIKFHLRPPFAPSRIVVNIYLT